MSGTSLDGADAVLADFRHDVPKALAFASQPFSPDLNDQLFSLTQPGGDTVDLAGEASLELADTYARVVSAVMALAGKKPSEICAIGCHGQTIRHRPASGFTVQLNDPARLAELSGIDVVADFRRRDMAAGGQGAPLVPAFHRAVFHDAHRSRAIVNIGGISNITWLPPQGRILGFDCGPGNVLMDAWCHRHLHQPFDESGRWAAIGETDRDLLQRLLTQPFLAEPPPKSTGRELFHMGWLQTCLSPSLRPQDVMSTLADFTAHGIVDSIERFCPSVDEIYLAGGGGRNTHLVARIRALAGNRAVDTTDALGVPTGLVEPLAFAWLAKKCIDREPVDLTTVTGARGPRILGAIYPA